MVELNNVTQLDKVLIKTIRLRERTSLVCGICIRTDGQG